MPDLDPTRRYLCRHVHTDGRRCGSPALRAQNFCYYHDRQRLPRAPLAGRMGIFRFQPIDDRPAIQIALYDILSRVSAGDLDNKRASILLYGLQIASTNLARQEKLQPATQPLEEVTNHHILGDLAPIEELPTGDADTNIAEPATAPPPQPQTPEPVILSEARSAQPKDPEELRPTTTADALLPPSTPTLSDPVILSERSEPKDPETAKPTPTADNSLPQPPLNQPTHELTLAAVHATASTTHPHHFARMNTASTHTDNPAQQTISTAHCRHLNQAVAARSSRPSQAVSCRYRPECHQPHPQPRRRTVCAPIHTKEFQWTRPTTLAATPTPPTRPSSATSMTPTAPRTP